MGMIYFASDFHLGIEGKYSSAERERQIVKWLHQIADTAEEIYFLGDIFDSWFEYRHAIPKGYARLLGKLAELRDRDIRIYFFTGNHDMWMFNYFEDAFGIPIYRAPIEKTIEGRKFLLGHGDGLGPGDHGYKFIKKVFANRFCQWLFARIHPNTGLRVMQYFSQRSRESTEVKQYLGPDHEWLIDYCEKKIATSPVDYFVFGHRHLPIQYLLSNGHSKYINLGDWLNFNSYAVFDGDNLRLKFFETEQIIYGNMRDV